jgi:hypothetical protein
MRAKASFSIFSLLGVLALVSVGLTVMPITCSEGAVPPLINYQGVLKDSLGVPYDGNATMVFSIWDDSTGGNRLWEETQAIVSVSHGLFHVFLGSTGDGIPDSAFAQPDAWLEVIANGNLLSPRRRVVSVAYAYRAAQTDTAEYARRAPSEPDADWVMDGDDIYHEQGDVGIGTTNPNARLDVDGTVNITGVTTFSSIPALPDADPTTDNQAARKAYVDTKITAPATPAQGDILYYDGSAWARLAAGTAGQLLETQGAGANPEWVSAIKKAKLGTYTGTGAQLAVTGLGFQPNFVWCISASSSTGHSVLRTSAMTGDNSFMVGYSGLWSNHIISLDSDGFTIGPNSSINTNGVTYSYLALLF